MAVAVAFAVAVAVAVAVAASHLDKPSSRPMQSNKSIEHYLLQSDWDRLEELGKQPPQGRDQLEDIVAIKVHRLGIVCPDADTLKRASAIVQAVSGNRARATDKRAYARGVRQKLKIVDKSTPWAFGYIKNYPRPPFELSSEVLSHAYGDARPINMPGYIDDSGFNLIVAVTPYKKMKTNRLDQTHHQDQTSVHGATHATDALAPYQDASPSPTAQPPLMNAGPFAAFMHALMHGVQHMGSQNTGGQFRSRLPLQLENSWGNCLISVPLAEHHT